MPRCGRIFYWRIDEFEYGECVPIGLEEDLWEPVGLLKSEEELPRFLRRCRKIIRKKRVLQKVA